MEHKRTSRESEQATALEEAYRRGFHHGVSHAIEAISALLLSGIPANGVAELCQAFEKGVVIPWRVTADANNTAPPRFDLEACQYLLREMKERQSS